MTEKKKQIYWYQLPICNCDLIRLYCNDNKKLENCINAKILLKVTAFDPAVINKELVEKKRTQFKGRGNLNCH